MEIFAYSIFNLLDIGIKSLPHLPVDGTKVVLALLKIILKSSIQDLLLVRKLLNMLQKEIQILPEGVNDISVNLATNKQMEVLIGLRDLNPASEPMMVLLLKK